jgi:hypothetical protein
VAHEGPAILLAPDNITLLDNIAKLAEFAARVADIRAAGNRALTPATEDLTDEGLGLVDPEPWDAPGYDTETGESRDRPHH